MQSPSRKNLWCRRVVRTLVLTSVGLTGVAHGAEEAPPLFLGAVEKISEPVQLKIRPNSRAACTLHQRFVSEEEAPSSQVITFETHVQGGDDTALLVQTVKGYEGTSESPAVFGYQHRMTIAADGLPTGTEARAIPEFPISAKALRQAALDGDIDIRDAIFSGRTYVQDEPLNRTPEETFRFLKPVIPRDLDLDTLVDRRDRSRAAGLVTTTGGRRALLFEIDAQMTTVRRSGATDTVLKGQVLVDVATGLVAGEDWTARIDKTSTDPFELITKVRCTRESDS
jgi:hypothetical protein